MARLLKINRRRYQTWEEGVEGFILFKSAQGICDITIRDYRYHLTKFFNQFPQSWDDNDCLKQSVLIFFAQIRHLAPVTHNMRRKYLKCFFSWVVKEGFLKSNPLDDIRLRHEEPRVRDLDNDKLKKLMGMFDKGSYSGLRDYAYLCLTLDTGIRPSEGLALMPDNLNLKSLEVFIPSFIAKTRVSRTLPISPTTVNAIRELISVRSDSWSSDTPLFATADGNPFVTNSWTKRLAKYSERLGFKISAYDLRHVFALMYLRNGGNALALQRTMGHTDLEMTKRYVNLTQNDLREIHSLVSPLGKIIQKKERLRKV